jgi:hypothetical protein
MESWNVLATPTTTFEGVEELKEFCSSRRPAERRAQGAER